MSAASGAHTHDFPLFKPDNRAVDLSHGGFLSVRESATNRELDFSAGDSLSLEAWVLLKSVPDGPAELDVISKGVSTTVGSVTAAHSYALRLIARTAGNLELLV